MTFCLRAAASQSPRYAALSAPPPPLSCLLRNSIAKAAYSVAASSTPSRRKIRCCPDCRTCETRSAYLPAMPASIAIRLKYLAKGYWGSEACRMMSMLSNTAMSPFSDIISLHLKIQPVPRNKYNFKNHAVTFKSMLFAHKPINLATANPARSALAGYRGSVSAVVLPCQGTQKILLGALTKHRT